MTTSDEHRPDRPGAATASGPGATEVGDASGARGSRIGPGRAVQVIWGSATDRGRVRKVNEDALLTAPPVFVVSDGMGGHAAGDVAAAIVVEEFGAALGSDIGDVVSPDWVLACVQRASRRIRTGSGGGATVVGVAITEHDAASYWLAFNIGDSRVYRCFDGELTQISVDHSYVQELVEAGELQREEMRRHPQRNVITRAVGLVGDADLDCWLIPAQQGERLMLCTDGITGELSDAEVGGILSAYIDPQLAADALVRASLSAGGRDNATAVVVDVLTVSGAHADNGVAPIGALDDEPDLERTLRRGERSATEAHPSEDQS